MNIKVAAFTVSEKYINTISVKTYARCQEKLTVLLYVNNKDAG